MIDIIPKLPSSTKILEATHQGELKIGNLLIPCYVLEDGRRVISQNSIYKSIGMSLSGGSTPGVQRLVSFLSGFKKKGLITKDLSVRNHGRYHACFQNVN